VIGRQHHHDGINSRRLDERVHSGETDARRGITSGRLSNNFDGWNVLLNERVQPTVSDHANIIAPNERLNTSNRRLN
jgi:hypothetical protein